MTNLINNLTESEGLSVQEMQLVNMEVEANKKNKNTVIILWLFFAGLGGHRFYLGNIGYAVAMMLLGWATFLIWPLVDIFFAMKEADRQNAALRARKINELKFMKAGRGGNGQS